MVRLSYLNDEVSSLKDEYGESKVRIGKGNDRALITGFSLPRGYKLPSTALLLEIPAGFGYGVPVCNAWVLLRENTFAEHLFDMPDYEINNVLKKKLRINVTKKQMAHKRWYWVCLHVWGSSEYDEETDGQSGDLIQKRIEEEETPPDDVLVGFQEYVHMIYYMLQKIVSGDELFLGELKRIKENHDEIINQISSNRKIVEIENNWRALTWQY